MIVIHFTWSEYHIWPTFPHNAPCIPPFISPFLPSFFFSIFENIIEKPSLLLLLLFRGNVCGPSRYERIANGGRRENGLCVILAEEEEEEDNKWARLAFARPLLSRDENDDFHFSRRLARPSFDDEEKRKKGSPDKRGGTTGGEEEEEAKKEKHLMASQVGGMLTNSPIILSFLLSFRLCGFVKNFWKCLCHIIGQSHTDPAGR